MGWLDKTRRVIADITKGSKTQPVIDGSRLVMGKISGMRSLTPGPKVNASQLRRWARTNEFVRTAINRRKQQIAQASWRLVRRDKPNEPPDPAVEKAVTDLFDMVNSKGDSFRSLMEQTIEDLLILDAGVIEKEKTLGGKIINLWPVNGATIAPEPTWDGSSPTEPRYFQIRVGQEPIGLRNDQIIYMMANPSTHTVTGWSPVETLVKIIRAELFAEDYNFEQIQRYGPRGLLSLGPGVSNTDRDAFREYWSSEIEGTEAIGIINGGSAESKTGPTFIPMTVDDFEKRLAYQRWLATKTAAVFQMDLMVFNLSEAIQKSLGKALTARTDEGANALARLVAEHLTREIVWEIDPTRNHRFEFDDLNDRDALAQAQIDQIYTAIGVTFPNEIRARDGKDPVEWGDEPWPDQTSALMTVDGEDPENEDGLGETDDPGKKGFAARAVPFVARTRRVKASSTRDSSASWQRSRAASTPPSTPTRPS